MVQQLTVKQLFDEFVTMRQTGTGRDEAWYSVLEKADHLKESHVQQLLGLAKNWEKREGYKFRDKASSTITHYRSTQAPDPAENVIKPLQARPAERGTSMLNADALKELEAQMSKKEQIAKPQQPSLQPTRQVPNSSDATGNFATNSQANEPSFFPPHARVRVYFKDAPDVITLEIPQNEEYVIGRITDNSPMAPDLDLNPVNAGFFGVSRLHAALKRGQNNLLITDLGSRNHTYINGERLHPHEVRVLKHNDQISFANLLTQIQFF